MVKTIKSSMKNSARNGLECISGDPAPLASVGLAGPQTPGLMCWSVTLQVLQIFFSAPGVMSEYDFMK